MEKNFSSTNCINYLLILLLSCSMNFSLAQNSDIFTIPGVKFDMPNDGYIGYADLRFQAVCGGERRIKVAVDKIIIEGFNYQGNEYVKQNEYDFPIEIKSGNIYLEGYLKYTLPGTNTIASTYIDRTNISVGLQGFLDWIVLEDEYFKKMSCSEWINFFNQNVGDGQQGSLNIVAEDCLKRNNNEICFFNKLVESYKNVGAAKNGEQYTNDDNASSASLESEKTASGQTKAMASPKSIQNDKESIYTKRQREADQRERAREEERKAKETEAQRRVAASQQQYEHTMDNNTQAKEYISRTFNSSNVSQEQEAQNFYSNLTQWNARKDHKAIADRKKARNMYYKAIKNLDNGKYQKAREIFDHLAQDGNDNLLEWDQSLKLDMYRVLAYIENGEQTNQKYWQYAYSIKEEDSYEWGSTSDNRYRKTYFKLRQRAAQEFQNENYATAADYFYKTYVLSGEHSDYYYAAIAYNQAGNPKECLRILKEIAYYNRDISNVEYYITDRKEDKELTFYFKDWRDSYISNNKRRYINPREKVVVVVTAAELREYIKKLNSFIQTTNNNPNKYNLEQENTTDRTTESKKEVSKTINNYSNLSAVEVYNKGVEYLWQGKNDKAIPFFEKAIQLKPDYFDALLNLSVSKLAQETKIIEEMNSLGTSTKDNIRYDELDNTRKLLYEEVLPYLEKAHQLNPGNTNVITTLVNIYNQLGMETELKEIKNKLDDKGN